MPDPTKRLLRFLIENAKADGTDVSNAVRDIITDLLHICDSEGFDFAERESSAREVYLEELEEARTKSSINQ